MDALSSTTATATSRPASPPPKKADSPSSQPPSDPAASRFEGSSRVKLSAAATAMTAAANFMAHGDPLLEDSVTDAASTKDGATDTDSLTDIAKAAKAEADSLQSALDNLQKAFVNLLRAFGLSDDEAASGAAAGRAAVLAAAETAKPVSDLPTFQIAETETLVADVREITFSMSFELADGHTTTVSATANSYLISYIDSATLNDMWSRSESPIVNTHGDGATEQTPPVAGEDPSLATDSQSKNPGALLLVKDSGSNQSLKETGQASITLDAIVPLTSKDGGGGRVVDPSTVDRNDGKADSGGNVRLDIEV
ncbi:MAG: hypothetical protein K9H25_19530 [Rhodospirillum sp.]|nr:hypothetical protein [Rhodospirillum sp.]MCF8488656.1 hypothetical protein [Rhodospirillum sp.]MCF8501739.1 hypothetical protein [Rhodospirillum sp.]